MRSRASSNVDHGDAPASLRAQGTYDVLRSLGTGSTGDLLLAVRHGSSGFRKLCVVKQLRRTLAMDASLRDMFTREGRLAARMNHPSIVSTYDVGEHEGALYIAMEYLEGQTLKSLLGAMRQSAYEADPLLWVRVLSDLLSGLHYAHELRGFDGQPLGVVHRDVGPHNVFVTYEGRVVLLDFGSARLCAEASRVDRGAIVDRLDYMAPELRAGAVGDRRADVYSAGVVLRELVAGARDEKLAAIVARATARDPNDRFATAAGMRDALEQYCDASGRMLRRDALASLTTVLFDEERKRAQEDVRARLARLDSSPDAAAELDPMAARVAEAAKKPRLELLEEDPVSSQSPPSPAASVPLPAYSIPVYEDDDVEVAISSGEILSASRISLSSSDAIVDSQASSVAVDEAAVSIPVGPETASGSLPPTDSAPDVGPASDRKTPLTPAVVEGAANDVMPETVRPS